MLLVLHDLSTMPKRHTTQYPCSPFIVRLGDNKFSGQEIQSAINDISLHSQQWGWFFQDKLNSRFLNAMRQQQVPLYLSNFIAIDNLIQLIIIGSIDIFKLLQSSHNIPQIRMPTRSIFLYLLHYQHILRQPLHRFDQIIFQSQLLIFRISSGLI